MERKTCGQRINFASLFEERKYETGTSSYLDQIENYLLFMPSKETSKELRELHAQINHFRANCMQQLVQLKINQEDIMFTITEVQLKQGCSMDTSQQSVGSHDTGNVRAVSTPHDNMTTGHKLVMDAPNKSFPSEGVPLRDRLKDEDMSTQKAESNASPTSYVKPESRNLASINIAVRNTKVKTLDKIRENICTQLRPGASFDKDESVFGDSLEQLVLAIDFVIVQQKLAVVKYLEMHAALCLLSMDIPLTHHQDLCRQLRNEYLHVLPMLDFIVLARNLKKNRSEGRGFDPVKSESIPSSQ